LEVLRMRRVLIVMVMLFIAAPLSADTEAPAVGDEVAIAIQNQKVYPMPAFYAAPAQPVAYGTIVTVTAAQADWFEVMVPGAADGWVHSTSVTGAIQHSSGDASSSGSVTTDEVMLAGRGFSEEVEESYSREHPDLDFGPVDIMEASNLVTPEELYEFLTSGNLIDAGEASNGSSR